MTDSQNTDTDPIKAKHSPRCVEMGWWLLHELDDGESCDTADDVAPSTPATWHPGRCYCAVFAGSHHVPGMRQVGLYGAVCKGDQVAPHDETTCAACLAGATDYRPRIEAGQTWISQHGTDHEVAGPGDEEGTWAMWGPTGHLYVISDARLYTAYTLDLDR